MEALIASTNRLAYCQSITVYTEGGGQMTLNGRDAYNHLQRHGQTKLNYYKDKYRHLVEDNKARDVKRQNARAMLIDYIASLNSFEEFCELTKKLSELNK